MNTAMMDGDNRNRVHQRVKTGRWLRPGIPHLVLGLVAVCFPSPATARQKFNASQDNVLLDSKVLLADLDGDGINELVSWNFNRIFVRSVRTVSQDGLLHHYEAGEIDTLFAGRFGGGGQDQLCVRLQQRMGTSFPTVCYRQPPGERRLTMTTTQSPFLSGKAVVGDFNGDGKDDLLDFNPATGAMKFYSKADPFTTPFAEMTISTGDMASIDKRNARILVGQFDGNGADDILIQSTSGTLRRYDSVVSSGTRTFSQAWRRTGLVGANQRAHVTRCNNGSTDCIVLNDVVDGGDWTWLNASADPVTNVTAGNLPDWTPVRVVFGRTGDRPVERGSDKRDDAIVSIDGGWSTLDARYDGSSKPYTYWARDNHADVTFGAGESWPIPKYDRLTVIKCRHRDLPNQDPYRVGYIDGLFSPDPLARSQWNFYEYWAEMTFGHRFLVSTITPWVTATIDYPSVPDDGESRVTWGKNCLLQTGIAYLDGGHYSTFGNRKTTDGGTWDLGAKRNFSLIQLDTPGKDMFDDVRSEDIVAQEVIHTWGLHHGLDQNGNDYGDWTDVMSSNRPFGTPDFGRAGPLLGPANLRFLDPGVLPSQKVLIYPASFPAVSRSVELAAWTRPENKLPVMIRLTNEPLDRTPNGFTWTEVIVSLRLSELFDQGFGGARGVVINGSDWTNSRQILLAGGVTSGTTTGFNSGAWSVRVDSIDVTRGTVTLTITN